MNSDTTSHDRALIAAALGGQTSAMSELMRSCQRMVYPLALRMLWGAEEAKDATQEILLKIATHLSSFEGKSAPSTWIYQIATNHLLNCRRSRAEAAIHSFECYGACLAQMADSAHGPEERAVVEEARIGCLLGMLACLDRTQRMVFLLGEVMELSDREGSEALQMSADNFRQVLSRARSQLYEFLRGNCGLVSEENPCRCAKKTRAFIEAKIVDPKRLTFVPGHLAELKAKAEVVGAPLQRFIDGGYASLFRELPEAPVPPLPDVLSQILGSGLSTAGTGPRRQGGASVD